TTDPVHARLVLVAPAANSAPPTDPGRPVASWSYERELVGAGRVDAAGEAAFEIEVPHPPLWWPAGLGGQPLAELQVRVGTHEEVRRIGFRHLAWERTPGSPADALPYGLRVNGVPVPLTGVNWAPADAQ